MLPSLRSVNATSASASDSPPQTLALAVFAQQNFDAQSLDVAQLVNPLEAIARHVLSAPTLNKGATVLNVDREPTPVADTIERPATTTLLETTTPTITAESKDWQKWIPWILIALAVLALLYALTKKSHKHAS